MDIPKNTCQVYPVVDQDQLGSSSIMDIEYMYSLFIYIIGTCSLRQF